MMMSSLRREPDTRAWYEEKVRRFGYDYRGLGFRTRTSQEKRFEALMEVGDLHGRRVLDVGCGFGDFLDHLGNRGIQPIYTGIDICGPMVARCQQRFPVSAGLFHVADVLEYRPDEPFDFVIASGLFGLASEGARERVRPTLVRLFSWARMGVAVNFLSARSPTPAEGRLYVEPSEALAWAFELTPAVHLDHTYLPNDFTLLVYRTPHWEEEGQARP